MESGRYHLPKSDGGGHIKTLTLCAVSKVCIDVFLAREKSRVLDLLIQEY
jgi:hypothetical protein